MKKFLPLLFLFPAICNAQFWTEDFTMPGCSNGNPAAGHTSTNGTWTVTSTGANDTYADVWYVSARSNNTGIGNCAPMCTTANNSTLHIGNATIPQYGIGPDSTATYLTGLLCGAFSICSTTNKRAESPVINCTGQQGISLSFIYIEGGEASDDDATFWYYDGNAWAQLDALAKTTICATTSGIWTSFMGNLPPSADNNPNVKIGFQWTNDNDGVGNDPSFAVDDIALTSLPSGSDETVPEGCNAYCDGSNIIIQSRSAYKILSVINMLGENIPYSLNGNTVQLKENTEGIYFLRIEAGKELVTRKVQMLR